MKSNVRLRNVAESFSLYEMLETNVQKIKTHFMFNNFYPIMT